MCNFYLLQSGAACSHFYTSLVSKSVMFFVNWFPVKFLK